MPARLGVAWKLADLWRCRGVARRSKIHKGYSLFPRLASAPNPQQRNRSLFKTWVLCIVVYSLRSAMTGSTRVARRAGTKQAIKATLKSATTALIAAPASNIRTL